MSRLSIFYAVPYICLFFVVFINALPLYVNNNLIKERIVQEEFQYFFIFFIFTIFFCFRGYINADWPSYEKAFNNAPTFFDGINSYKDYVKTGSRFEPGFILFTIIVKTFSSNFLIYQGISSFIDLFFLFILLYRISDKFNCSKCFVALCFYLFAGGLNQITLMRNNKALLFFLYSLKYLNEKKFRPYFICNLIGVFFHISSIFYIPVYFLLTKKIPKKYVIILFILGNVFYFLHLDLLRTSLSIISPFIPGRLGALIYFYLNNTAGSGLGFGLSFFEKNLFLILIISKMDKLEMNENNTIIMNSFYLVYIFTFFFRDMGIIVTRFANLFIFCYWFLVPQLYSSFSLKNKKTFLLILFFYGCLRFLNSCSGINMYYDNYLFDNITGRFLSRGKRIELLDKYFPELYIGRQYK